MRLSVRGDKFRGSTMRRSTGTISTFRSTREFPFLAHYPKPATSQEGNEFRCTVLELLDPAKHLGDGFDGIFCKTRRGKYEINLPLIELEVPEDSPDFQLIEDYWYWFWNWR